MTYSVALNFEDGVTRFINCHPGETVLDSAYRHQINLPMDCSDGVCGTCKCACSDGEYELGDDYIDEALTDDEKEKRLVLTCQMVPESDCVLEIPVASGSCKTGTQSSTARVQSATALSATSFELKVELEKGIDFLPGQYVNIRVPDSNEQVRAYSFTSLPGSNEAGFLIRNVKDGLMSSWLQDKAAAGVELQLTGPLGVFYLRKVERPVLMLAGGTGLAPFLSMLATLRQNGCSQPVHLIYGVTQDADLVCIEQLETFAKEIDGFTFKTVVADTGSEHPRKGYVTQHMEDAPLSSGDVDIYLCGPPPMVDAVVNFLEQEGIKPNSFHYERFTPSVSKEAAAS